MKAIEIKNLKKSFGSVHAVQGVDLAAEKGTILGLLGPNGAGKSTTIKILMNLIFPDRGKASIAGTPVHQPEARKRVGYLPENPYFYDYLNAEELLWFGGRTTGMTSQAIREQSDILLNKVNLHSARKRPLRSYSKGMVQRAGLALALIHGPDVVILDEPMSGLDPLGRKMVGDLIVELREQGKTVFFSSHILNDIERFSDRAGIIIGGRLRLVERVDHLMTGGISLEDVFLREVRAAGGGLEV